MSEAAKTREEALRQILAFDERQIRDAEQQGDYATRQLVSREGMLATNRKYYEEEVQRCIGRVAFFRPRVEAMQWVLSEMLGEAPARIPSGRRGHE